jgi:LuxR family transcriptional regulator, maltose regulon positive regulatory protein
MVGALVPLLREQPMFAQWVASRSLAGRAFREFIERQPFPGEEDTGEEEAVPASRFPAVVAKSLGPCSVSVGGRDVTEEGWSSLRAKELFFLFLANPSGLRKEEAVGHLFPELAPAKCNSAFHSNLYRLRKAIYQESVIKRDGGYVLNPDGTFTWDVEQFEGALAEAQVLPAGSEERAAAYKNALTLYQGPFAEAFYSEWAETVRRRTADRSHQALSTLAGYYAGRGQFGEAANCMERLLAGDRLNEEAAYQLATYRTRGGQTTLALAFIDDYRRLYSDEYGEDVPERFVHLRAQIAAGGHG